MEEPQTGSGQGQEPPEVGPWWDRMQLGGPTWSWKRGAALFVIGGVATLVVHFIGR